MGQGAGVWLQTARLRLRPLSRADEAGVVAGLNDPDIARWLATTPYPYTASAFYGYLATAPEGETFAIHDSGGFAGMIGAGAELGFWVSRHAQGRGYAKEASAGLLRVLFEFYNQPVAAGYFTGNAASRSVLEWLGFREAGRSRKFCRALAQDMDHVDMVLDPADFRRAFAVGPASCESRSRP
jgi:[ribosomal protein S5]-alanine N-acetyltransferase